MFASINCRHTVTHHKGLTQHCCLASRYHIKKRQNHIFPACYQAEVTKSIVKGIGIGFLSCIGIGIGIAKTISQVLVLVLVLLRGHPKYWYWYWYC